MTTKTQILFRCSRLGDLMTGSMGGLTERQAGQLAILLNKQKVGQITEKQLITLGELLDKKHTKPELSETAKAFIRSMWLESQYGYREEVMSDEMMKGHLCEQDSLALVQKVLGGEFRMKNTARLKNDYVAGTPDVILKKVDVIEDVKTSYNLRTFVEADLIKNYLWQLQGYMWLSGYSQARLIYCLVPTPENLIMEQKKRYYFRFDCDEANPDYMRITEQIDRNNDLILGIPAKKRIKVFNIAYDPDMIEALKVRIELAREYYQTLSL